MNDWYWLAGIIEGEGSFRIVKYKTRKDSSALGICVKMSDEDIILRCSEVTGEGSVTGPYLRHGTNKPLWTWSVQNHAGIVKVMEKIYPILGYRRKKRARDLLRYILRKENTDLPFFLKEELRVTEVEDLLSPHITQKRRTT